MLRFVVLENEGREGRGGWGGGGKAPAIFLAAGGGRAIGCHRSTCMQEFFGGHRCVGVL